MDYYDIGPADTFGHEFEEGMLELYKSKIEPGCQMFSSELPFLLSTLDGFIINSKIPVEIKTKRKGSIDNLIYAYYHKLQLTVFVTNNLELILINYIIDTSFHLIKINSDQQFIDNCFQLLEYG